MTPRVAADAVVVALSLGLAACVVTNNDHLRVGSAPYTQGSDTVSSETRPLDDFHAVSASRGIGVVVSTGESNAATVTGDDNLLAHVTTEVTDGMLVVTIEGSLETRNPIRVSVTSAAPIDAIAADAGSSVDAEDLQSTGLEFRATSGSSIRGGGRTDSLVLAANSGSTVDLRNVEASVVQVDVSVGSTAHVLASDAVRGSCTSGSTLQVDGNPPTVEVTSDSGSTVND